MEILKEIIIWNIPAIIIAIICYYKVSKIFIKPVQLPKHVWTFVYPNDEKSPKIMGLSDNSHLIFYPKNSTKYLHVLDDKCKFVSVLEGVVYDEKSNKTFHKGDRIKIYPNEEYVPYTKNQDAYLKVCIDDCSLSLADACGY